MQELPVLTDISRKILKCCVYDLWDVRRDDYAIQPHMIHSYFDEKFPKEKQISLIEILDSIIYFEEIGLARDIECDMFGKLKSFRLTHKGFYYFELEKALHKREFKNILFNSILFPIIVSIITTLVTLLASALIA